MSAIAEETNVAPDLATITVPMSEAAPDPDADYNAAPPPLPELFDATGKPVPYIADLMLGKDGIKKEFYDEKDENGTVTGKAAYYVANLLAKAVAPADGRNFDVRNCEAFLNPASRYTSFVERSKGLSPIAHLAKVAGLDIKQYETVDELAPDLARELAKRGVNSVQARVFIQWQWYSKSYKWTNARGVAKEGKTVRFGMKNADTQLDGVFSPKITFKETGEELTARAVIVKIEPLT